MASSKVIKRRRRTSNCVVLFDHLIAKSSKLFGHAQCADSTSLKLLDLLFGCQNRWSSLTDRLKSNCKLLETEVHRLRIVQEETVAMLRKETECRRRVERARDSLRRKIDAIRDVLVSNDVDEAKRQLENIELSALTPNRSLNNTHLDHSAGSLLDPVNVSLESHSDGSHSDKKTPPRRRRPSSAGHVINLSQIPTRRSMRLSKFRSSSVPRITTHTTASTSALTSKEQKTVDVPRTSRKRKSDKSDDSYFGVEVKRSVFNLPLHQTVVDCNMVPSTVTEESSSYYSSDAGNPHGSNNAPFLTPMKSMMTPKPTQVSRLNRPHNFISRSVLRMDVCSACGRRIAFGKTAYKCAVCRLLVHPACRKELAQTCVPPSATRTPLSSAHNVQAWATSPRSTPSNTHISSALVPALPFGNTKLKGPTHSGTIVPPASPTLSTRLGLRNINLNELCPADQFPRIPALIIHCVTEIVARGMNTVGIYRVSGSEKQVRDLYDKFFRSKMTPGLALVDDIHVICGCLKLFLRNLSEPLVTFEQRAILAAASERAQSDPERGIQQVLNVLECLPAPNRDTLSYIVLHLKLVSRTPACQMGEDNLAKVFGPTLVGYSCPEPQPMQTVTETRTQQAVVKLLFSVPDHIYSAILSNPPSAENSQTEQEHTTYFSPVSVRVDQGNSVLRTPMHLRQTPRRFAGLGMSSRKRFLPSFLSSNRTDSDT